MAFTKVIAYMFLYNDENLLHITVSSETVGRPIFKYQRGVEVPYGSEQILQLPLYVKIFKLLLQVAFTLVHSKSLKEQPTEEVSNCIY